MAEVYLRPEDVRPEHARQVLEFLNAAQTAEEIGTAVEIADELDVGIRLGERILARRAQLGRFTDLAQIRAIPYIGPERFTEIVITLSDARLPGTEVDSADLLREIAALRAEIRALRATGLAPPRVTVRTLQESPYLGQTVDLLITVTEADGIRPRVDAPLTLSAPGGRLRAVDGAAVVEGTTVTTRTDGDGLAKAVLLPQVSEELLPAQQDTLEVALRLLSSNATRPREAEAGLRELARRYRWDGNSFLRAAIDVYFRDYGAGLMETVNARDYMVAWRSLDVTVQAHLRESAREGPEGTSILASAALTVRMRDWLGAWLEMLQVVTAEDARLDDELMGVPSDDNAGLMVGRVYGRVRDFMTAQKGVVGEYVGRRVAESSLRSYVQSGIANLPTEQQLAVFPALDVASRTVAVGGTAMFTAVGQTRVELEKEIDSRITDSIGDIFEDGGVLTQFAERLSGVESQIQTKADVAAVEGLRNEFDARLDTKVDAGVFETFQRDVDIRLESRVGLDTFATFQEQTNTRIEAKADRGEFDRLSTDVAREVGTIRTNVSRLDRDMLDLRNR
ncbi:MAG TPA: hypothetical protein VFZ18_13470 [Longimicrobiaceae bacterium]